MDFTVINVVKLDSLTDGHLALTTTQFCLRISSILQEEWDEFPAHLALSGYYCAVKRIFSLFFDLQV